MSIHLRLLLLAKTSSLTLPLFAAAARYRLQALEHGLLDEIAPGVGQIDTAINQPKQITQHNASAAEEMRRQAEQLQPMGFFNPSSGKGQKPAHTLTTLRGSPYGNA
jgi:hypothetical protein